MKPRDMHIGVVYKGLEFTSEPFKVDYSRDAHGMAKCIFCGNEDEYVLTNINNRIIEGCGCRKFLNKRARFLSFKDWCEQNNSNNILSLWDYELNEENPEDVSFCTGREYYFKCPRGIHESEKYKLINLTRRERSKSICTKCNSFAQHIIDVLGEGSIEKYWDYEKNTKDPWVISYGSREKVWLICQETDYHGSYEATMKHFLYHGARCPYCNSKKIHPKDSFAQKCIDEFGDNFFEKYWDNDKNIIDPWTIAPHSNTATVYIKCQNNQEHESYAVHLSNPYYRIDNCPQCFKEEHDSKLQKKVAKYIKKKYNYELFHEYECSIAPKNPKTGRLLPFDNEVIINEDVKLLIEVHGEQHFSIESWTRKEAKRRGVTPEEQLAYQRWKDAYKKQYALDHGYYYLEIPYTAERNDQYKSLIDTTISKILSSNSDYNVSEKINLLRRRYIQNGKEA